MLVMFLIQRSFNMLGGLFLVNLTPVSYIYVCKYIYCVIHTVIYICTVWYLLLFSIQCSCPDEVCTVVLVCVASSYPTSCHNSSNREFTTCRKHGFSVYFLHALKSCTGSWNVWVHIGRKKHNIFLSPLCWTTTMNFLLYKCQFIMSLFGK